MSEVVAFVNARLDEWASVAGSATDGPWWLVVPRPSVPAPPTIHADDGAVAEVWSPIDGMYIATSDPAHVLRVVAALRAIVASYERSVRAVGEGLSVPDRRNVCALATIWPDHADYRAEWAP